jgi:hypothetical protein
MKGNAEPKTILKHIAGIERMERGKLCPMRTGVHYNHQTWEKGRNVARYVPHAEVQDLQKAIAGYQQYLKLTKAYADEIIRRTRLRQPNPPSNPAKQKRRKLAKRP